MTAVVPKEKDIKAGPVGVAVVALFGIATILMVFVATYMWSTGDEQLAAAVGVGSIAIPVTVGFFVSELSTQRAGAYWFVIAASVLIGALAAWAYTESDDFINRRDQLTPTSNAEALVDVDL